MRPLTALSLLPEYLASSWNLSLFDPWLTQLQPEPSLPRIRADSSPRSVLLYCRLRSLPYCDSTREGAKGLAFSRLGMPLPQRAAWRRRFTSASIYAQSAYQSLRFSRLRSPSSVSKGPTSFSSLHLGGAPTGPVSSGGAHLARATAYCTANSIMTSSEPGPSPASSSAIPW